MPIKQRCYVYPGTWHAGRTPPSQLFPRSYSPLVRAMSYETKSKAAVLAPATICQKVGPRTGGTRGKLMVGETAPLDLSKN
eukprot:CAMPEP_0167832154 /NCGR_PEP_ID=MMETSP0112_2-20121227/14149_1 /TAXON_ID=91324 /ORGANISM="Lotharella globosa, Strain CCCM811" /LENGTH=80 /DNA_ID=CAMNT_0007737111 /DNA_START=204 /DNA_END=443 /DNA_ORIENTATION=-